MAQMINMTEATRQAAKSEGTLRRLISTGEVEAKKDGNGRYQISQESLRNYLVTKAQPTATIGKTSRHENVILSRNGLASRSNDKDENEKKLLLEIISHLKSELERERNRIESLEQRIEKLDMERTQHLNEIKAFLTGKTGNMLSRWFRK
jgi:DNA-binding transcriptional regulator/RsmH inhibitor MraZ